MENHDQPSTALTRPTADDSRSKQAGQITDEHIRGLWRRMARFYGHRWTSNYGEADDGTWRRGLQGCTPLQFACALERILVGNAYREWPPTLPQFRDLALGRDPSTPRTYLGSQATEAQKVASRKMLPIFGARRMGKDEAMRKMREKLGRKHDSENY